MARSRGGVPALTAGDHSCPRARNMTAQDLLRTPNDGPRRELVRGVTDHDVGRARARRNAYRLASGATRRGERTRGRVRDGDEVCPVRGPDTVHAPEVVALVQPERVEEVGEKGGYCPVRQTLAVEIVSPGDAYTEVEGKVAK